MATKPMKRSPVSSLTGEMQAETPVASSECIPIEMAKKAARITLDLDVALSCGVWYNVTGPLKRFISFLQT